MHPNLIDASEGDEIKVGWQRDGRLLANLETKEANKKDRIPMKQYVKREEDMLCKSKHFTLNTVELPQETKGWGHYHHPMMLMHPIKLSVPNVLPPGQKCTYTVIMGC